MPETQSPTRCRRELGTFLRTLRLGHGLTVEQVAGELRCSPSRVSRLETGQRSATFRDVRILCRLYGVSDETQLAHLRDLAHDGKQRAWWESYESSLSYFQPISPELRQTTRYEPPTHEAGRQRNTLSMIDEQVAARCPVCCRPDDGAAACSCCGWRFPSDDMHGPVILTTEAEFTAASVVVRRYGLPAAVRATGQVSNLNEVLLLQPADLARDDQVWPGHIKRTKAADDLDNPPVAVTRAEVCPALLHLTDGKMQAIAFVETGQGAISAQTTAVGPHYTRIGPSVVGRVSGPQCETSTRGAKAA